MVDEKNGDAEAVHAHEENGGKDDIRSASPVQAIKATLDAAGGAPNPWGSGHRRLYLACLVLYLCSTMNGEFEFTYYILPPSQLIFLRLRWVSDGIYQRPPRVPEVLQSIIRRLFNHRSRLLHLPDRTDDGCSVYMDLRLERSKVDRHHKLVSRRVLSRLHVLGTHTPLFHRRPLPPELLLDYLYRRRADAASRSCAAAASCYCGGHIQHAVLHGEHHCDVW